MSIEDVVLFFFIKFPNVDWDVEQHSEELYCIIVNDFDFYRSEQFTKWKQIATKKFYKVKFFTCYKKFKHLTTKP